LSAEVEAPACRRLQGQRVLVTGAGGLIGRATAVRLAQEGAASLVITDISERKLSATAQAVRTAAPGCEVLAHRCSVLSLPEVDALRAAAGEAPLDVLVNVVGGLMGRELYQSVWDMPEERWDGAFQLNLKTIFHMVRTFGAAMRQRPGGRIVNVASIAFGGDPDQPDYAAAKAGVVSFTRSLAADLAPHVNVNCVAPGLISDDPDALDPSFASRYVQRSVLRRAGGSTEAAAAIAFLASRDASFVTGAVLPVSGGIWAAL
jgi:NAD(P)-dependent dehydrogenase (short-subunit alcohol dehydrogenase family)